MKRILIAVDGTRGSTRAAETLIDFFSTAQPVVTLVYVQKVLGQSLVGEGMLMGPEMDTLREALQGTEYQVPIKLWIFIMTSYRKQAFLTSIV
jgi:nucleotide-binding universal stress UspA family protein